MYGGIDTKDDEARQKTPPISHALLTGAREKSAESGKRDFRIKGGHDSRMKGAPRYLFSTPGMIKSDKMLRSQNTWA